MTTETKTYIVCGIAVLASWLIRWLMDRAQIAQLKRELGLTKGTMQSNEYTHQQQLKSMYTKDQMYSCAKYWMRHNQFSQKLFDEWLHEEYGEEVPERPKRKVKYNYPWESGYKPTES